MSQGAGGHRAGNSALIRCPRNLGTWKQKQRNILNVAPRFVGRYELGGQHAQLDRKRELIRWAGVCGNRRVLDWIGEFALASVVRQSVLHGRTIAWRM